MNLTSSGGGRRPTGALLVGYLTVLVVLYHDPERGVEAATASNSALFYFAVAPSLGVGAGVYDLSGGPYGTLVVFLAGSYLGFLGVVTALGGLLSLTRPAWVIVLGIVMIVTGTIAIVGRLVRVGGVFDRVVPSVGESGR